MRDKTPNVHTHAKTSVCDPRVLTSGKPPFPDVTKLRDILLPGTDAFPDSPLSFTVPDPDVPSVDPYRRTTTHLFRRRRLERVEGMDDRTVR